MKNKINDLINSDKSSLSPDDIRQMLIDIIKEAPAIVQSVILERGVKIYRAREVNNISEIASIDDISYLKPEYNNSYKRASSPNQTMFYGIKGSTYPASIMGCMGELCDCLRNKNATPRKYLIAVSEWCNTDDLTLSLFPSFSSNKSEIFNAGANQSEYKDILAMFKDEKPRQFLEFINAEFKKEATKESDYWVTAIFSELLMSCHSDRDGLIYESVACCDPTLKDVVCFAIKPNSVDNKLQCRNVVFYEFDFISISQPITPKRIHEIQFDK